MSRNVYLTCHICGKVEERDAEFIEDICEFRENPEQYKTYECESCSGYHDDNDDSDFDDYKGEE